MQLTSESVATHHKGGMDEEQAIKVLKAAGYKIDKPTKYKKHTLEIDEKTLAEFEATQRRLGIKKKEAVNAALSDWVRKHHGDKKPPGG